MDNNAKIDREIERLQVRLASVEHGTYWMLRLYVGRLDEAERIRAAALRLVKGSWWHEFRGTGGMTGVRAIREPDLLALGGVLRDVEPFRFPTKGAPPMLRKMLGEIKSKSRGKSRAKREAAEAVRSGATRRASQAGDESAAGSRPATARKPRTAGRSAR